MKPNIKRLLILPLLFITLASCTSTRQGPVRRANAGSMGLDESKLVLIDSVINDAVAKQIIPGAVVSIVRKDAMVFLKAYGNRSVVPDTIKMTEETMFDLASVSKCVGTTLSFMQLIESGKVRLTDNVSRYIPGFLPWTDEQTGKQDEITVQDLLTHSSGLSAGINWKLYLSEYAENTPDSAVNFIATRVKRHFKPGTDYLYSCVNFLTLQIILEKVTGMRLCDYAQENIFNPLGLKHTTYFPLYDNPQSNPDAAYLRTLCAPTEVQENGQPLVAAVHDPTARLVFGGNSGNAGVFSTAEDLAAVAAMILGEGSLYGHKILGKETVRTMLTIPRDNDPKVSRTLGWDTFGVRSGISGDIFNKETAVGHTGYTGTSIVIDPDTQTALIILAHRVHPHDNNSLARTRATVASILAGAIVE